MARKKKKVEKKHNGEPEGILKDNGEWEAENLYGEEKTTVESLNVEESLARQLETARAQIQRMASEFDHFRKRTRTERGKTLLYANEALVAKLLPVLDDFDRALEHIEEEDPSGTSDIFAGVRLIHKRLVKTLDDIGVRTFEATGQRFDPAIHEAVQIQEHAGLGPGVIISEFEQGYMYHDRLLRAAKVVVTPLNNKVAPQPGAVEAPEAEVDEPEQEELIEVPLDIPEVPEDTTEVPEVPEDDVSPPEIPEEEGEEAGEADLVEAQDIDQSEPDDFEDFLELTPEFRELSDEEKVALASEDDPAATDTLPDAEAGSLIRDADWEMDELALEDPDKPVK